MGIPKLIGQAKVIHYTNISELKSSTKTTHIVGNQLRNDFSGLAICKYENEGGYYLFYCDEHWQDITDTWHETIEDAKDQAEYEYNGTISTWVSI